MTKTPTTIKIKYAKYQLKHQQTIKNTNEPSCHHSYSKILLPWMLEKNNYNNERASYNKNKIKLVETKYIHNIYGWGRREGGETQPHKPFTWCFCKIHHQLSPDYATSHLFVVLFHRQTPVRLCLFPQINSSLLYQLDRLHNNTCLFPYSQISLCLERSKYYFNTKLIRISLRSKYTLILESW